MTEVPHVYSLVIVDDEEIIRKGLTSTIDWPALGFHVVATAGNGREALRVIERVTPRVVLTDIKMPAMDGLTLLRLIKERTPEIKIVLLSGFEEFQYAKLGLQLGAEGYILKLSIEEDIRKVFKKLYKKLKEEESRLEALNSLKSERNSLLLRDLFRRILAGEVGAVEMSTKDSALENVSLGSGLFCVTCIHADFTDAGQGTAVYRRNNFPEWLEKTVDAESRTHDFKVVFPHIHELIVVHCDNRLEERDFHHRVVTWCRRVKQKLAAGEKTAPGLRISIGVGSSGEGWRHIKKSYIQAREVSFFQPTGEPVTLSEWERLQEKEKAVRLIDGSEWEDLVLSTIWGNKTRIRRDIDGLCARLKDLSPSVGAEDLQALLFELIGTVSNRLRAFNIEIGQIYKSESEIFEIVRSIHTFLEMDNWMREFFLTITERMSEIRSFPAAQNIKKAARYVNEHFGEKITLEEMASHACISPSHFSVLFKKVLGVTFTDYVISIRMQKARQMIERGFKVKETAQIVGYEDAHHFGKMFKKYHGFPPLSLKTRSTDASNRNTPNFQ
jgi:two-component system response regulator YesN